MCGGTARRSSSVKGMSGLSPRVRGNPLPSEGVVGLVGSIPACAGEPPAFCSTTSAVAVYPRVCGGTVW